MDHRPPIGRNPSDEELRALLHDYLFLEQGNDDQQCAFDDAIHLLSDAPEDCWRLIELAADMDLTLRQAAFFAAGPVEDILGDHGDKFIERLEASARARSGMRIFVACIWRGGMSDAIWGRVLALREKLHIEAL